MKPVAVVTGGAGALGRAVVRSFDEHGYEVHLSAVGEEERARYEGPGIVHVADLSSLKGAKKFAESVGGQVKCLACIAGGFDMVKIADASEKDFEKMISINAKTAFYSLSAFHEGLKGGAPSSVILTGAQAYEGRGGMAIYAGSKAFVVSLTRSASQEWKKDRIRVNAILPDAIDTPANRSAMPNADFEKWAKPEEIADVILYLCSDEAKLITGEAIRVGR